MEALLPRFRAAHTQVLGISVDSIFCHGNWAVSLGGICFPLLADFHPKGEVAKAYDLYLDAAGITDRATVIIDADGNVKHISSVTPAGKRDIAELAALCEGVDKEYSGDLSDIAEPAGLSGSPVLFVKSSCGFSNKVLIARENLGLAASLPVRNVSDDGAAKDDLVKLAGSDQAPCLVIDGKPIQESDEIVAMMCKTCTDL